MTWCKQQNVYTVLIFDKATQANSANSMHRVLAMVRYHQGRNGKFCITAVLQTRTSGILSQVLAVNRASHLADLIGHQLNWVQSSKHHKWDEFPCHNVKRQKHLQAALYDESSNRRRQRHKKCQTESYAAANSSVFRCALNVVRVAELFVDEDREFQTVRDILLCHYSVSLVLHITILSHRLSKITKRILDTFEFLTSVTGPRYVDYCRGIEVCRLFCFRMHAV